MPKSFKIALGLFIFFASVALGLIFTYQTSKKKLASQTAQTSQEQKRQSPQEAPAGPVVSRKGFALGYFVKVEGQKIFINEAGEEKSFDLDKNLYLVCTQQPIDENTQKLDYNLIQSPVKKLPSQLATEFEKDQLIVLPLAKKDGKLLPINTIINTRCL